MGKVLTFYNFKGGVGKTALSVITANSLHKYFKVLLIDLDSQANATDLMAKTYNINKYGRNMFNAFVSSDIKPSIVKVDDNLSLGVGSWDMSNFNELIETQPKSEQPYLLSHLIEPIKDDYDFILLDVPPTLSTLITNAMMASDAVSLVLQTIPEAFNGLKNTITYLTGLKSNYNAKFSLLGIILNQVGMTATDKQVTSLARLRYEDAVFNSVIKDSARVKHWSLTGMKGADYWDLKTLKMFDEFLNELLNRMGIEPVFQPDKTEKLFEEKASLNRVIPLVLYPKKK